MKRYILILLTLHFTLFTLHSLSAGPIEHEVTVYPFAATITHQADLVIEEYVPLDAKRPGKKWTFKNPNVSKRTVWRVTAESNTVFNAWLDTDNNGKYDIGEPFGTSAGRKYPEIELTDISPITPRIDLVSQKSDRAKTAEQIKSKILDDLERYYSGASPEIYSNALSQLNWMGIDKSEVVNLDSDPFHRIRVVLWMINDRPAYLASNDSFPLAMWTILDKKVNTSVRSCLTEADFLVGKENAFDLDWEQIYDKVISSLKVLIECGEVTRVIYIVVVGDGAFDWNRFTKDNYAVKTLGPCIIRNFGENRVKPNPLIPIVNGSSVTLVWKTDVPPFEDYTAYRAKIMSGGTEVHDTGLFRNPARWEDGSFHWTITNAIPSGTYNWKIAAFNSKFKGEQMSPDDSSTSYTNGVPFTIIGD